MISVSLHPPRLLELLWVREAYGLRPHGAVPRLEHAPRRAYAAEDNEAWSLAWDDLWAANMKQEATGVPPGLPEKLETTAPSSPERAGLLRSLTGPTWASLFGDAAFGEEYAAWSKAQSVTVIQSRSRSLDESPERIATQSLTQAWRAGLRRVITLPCRGNFSQAIDGTALLITDAAREDPTAYSTTLRTFPTT